MKTSRTRLLTAFAAALAMPGICFAEDAGQAVAAEASGGGEAAGTERKRAPASNFLPIVRGRFPLMLVHAVRFDEVLAKIGNKDLAGKLATSVGKIFDIRKGRNFGYIGKGWKPTESDVQEAKAWAAQIGAENAKGLVAAGDVSMINTLVDQYTARGFATAAEAAAQAAAKPKSNFDKKPEGGAPATLPASTTAAAGSKAGSADDLLG